MAKINENSKRTIIKVKSHIRVLTKKPEKSRAELFDERMARNARSFDKKYLGLK